MTACPYCGLNRTRQTCIGENMRIGVLPACASGPRFDAPDTEKRAFANFMRTNEHE